MNKPRNPILSQLLIMLVLVTMASCASHKHTISPVTFQTNDRFVVKFKADVSGLGVEFKDVNGQIRVCYDSLIWFSASAFAGVENVRALATCDSVFLINRVDKTYIAEPIVSLQSMMNDTVSLQTLQHSLFDKAPNDPVYLQFGSYKAILHYESITPDTDLSFPFKINSSYERIKL